MTQRKTTAVPRRRSTSGSKRKRTTASSRRKTKPLLKYEILGLILCCLGIFVTIGTIGIDTGSIGHSTDTLFAYVFGIGRIIPALALILLGLRYIIVRQAVPVGVDWGAGCVLFILFLGLVHILFVPEHLEFMPLMTQAGGGVLGGIVAVALRHFLGQTGAVLAIVLMMIVIVMIWKQLSISKSVTIVSDKAAEGIHEASQTIRTQWKEHQEKKRIFDLEKEEKRDSAKREKAKTSTDDVLVPEIPAVPEAADDVLEIDVAGDANVPATSSSPADVAEPEPVVAAAADKRETVVPEPVAQPAVVMPPVDTPTTQPADVLAEEFSDLKPIEIEKQATAVDLAPAGRKLAATVQKPPYPLPSLSMLSHGRAPSSSAADEVRENARILHETLQSFNIEAKILHASQGPAVTRYELEPASGVKVSKIVNLADDIALKLAAVDVRIEAPIPGKAAIGIEVPNKQVAGVNLRDVLDTDEFKRAVGGIPVGLGKDIAGNPVIADLSKMPHLLVAGSTGSGKSVCINTLIASILFKQHPCDVKLILIDPKVVELSNYNGIPHLLTPVVTDAKKAASVLHWAVREMDNRYRKFAETGTRDLARYNSLHPEEAFPFIVIIIDELADLMMVASNDVEDAICRLAQKARACGMHLVLATQRPSVDVLTGIIKANVPSRISFAVSSQIDSRTILDMSGAEKLLGKGDMLFYPMGASKPLRVQGAFISDGEIDALVEYIKEQSEPEYDEQVRMVQQDTENAPGGYFEDELMEQAVELVLETSQASASMLQRRFRIGYTRAARLVDTMEAMHIVGPGNGSKAREILMSPEEVHAKYFAEKS